MNILIGITLFMTLGLGALLGYRAHHTPASSKPIHFNKADLRLKSLACVIGVGSMYLSSFGISCWVSAIDYYHHKMLSSCLESYCMGRSILLVSGEDVVTPSVFLCFSVLLAIQDDGSGGVFGHHSPNSVAEIILNETLFAIPMGMEMFDKFWEWRMYYTATMNALLTLVGSLYTLVVSVVWRVTWGVPFNVYWGMYYMSDDGKVSIPEANCMTNDRTRFVWTVSGAIRDSQERSPI